MFSEKDKRHRTLLLLIGAFTILLGVLVWFVPPGADPDPSYGFEVMRCMENGGHFNMLSSPDPLNIAHDSSIFLSWWSPGQYLLPYFFKAVLKVTLGHALVLTIVLCMLIGLAGFYRLFKRLGFSQWIAALSVAFIAGQQFFILPYIFYTGGEVLLFAFAGWYLYGCFGFKNISWQLLLFIFIAGLVGFFAKSSFIWIYAAGVACIWINLSASKKNLLTWLRNGIVLGIPFILSFALIYVGYLSKGDNPSSNGGPLLVTPQTFSFPLASPLLSGFSLDELFNGFIYHPDGPVFSFPVTTAILIGLAIASLVFAFVVYKKLPYTNYVLAFIAFYSVAVVFFVYLYLKQSPISYEGRHFRIVGLLAIPGMIWLLHRTKITRLVLAVVWIAFICWELKFFGVEYKGNYDAPHGSSGMSQQLYDKETLNTIVQLDAVHRHNATFVVTSPDVAAEISNNRVITLDDLDDMPKEDFEQLTFAGTSGTLYMLMPKSFVEKGLAAGTVKAFTGYHHFNSKKLSDRYYLYWAEN